MAKSTKTQPVNVDVADLKKVYLHTFDSFATDPSVIEEEVDGINAKYARQLLKVLTDASIVAMSDVNGEADVWQTFPQTSDEITREEAEARFDEWAVEADLHAVTPTKEPKAKRNDVGVHPCYCGCGENVPGTSFYRPGHDARHAGVIGRLVASTGNKDHLNELPSAKLTEKAQGIATKALAKADAKRKAEHERAEAKAAKNRDKANATKQEVKAPASESGFIRVGRNDNIPAIRIGDKVTYVDAKGTEKVASKSAAASFKVAS